MLKRAQKLFSNPVLRDACLLQVLTIAFIACCTAQALAGSNPTATLTVQVGHSSYVNTVAYSPDGKLILTGGFDNLPRLWDANTGKLLRSFEGHSDNIGSVSFSPDGSKMITGSWDQTSRIWDVETGVSLHVFTGHSGMVESAYSSDGSRILTTSPRDGVRVWNSANGQLLSELSLGSFAVGSFALSPDNQRLLVSNPKSTAQVWDISTGKMIHQLDKSVRRVTSVAYSADGSRMVTGTRDRTAQLWDARTGKLLHTMRHTHEVNAVSISQNGKYLATGSGKEIRVWDTSSGKLKHNLRGHQGNVRTVIFSPGDKHILSGGTDDSARLWDVSTSRLLRTFRGLPLDFNSVAYSPDGARIVTGSNNHNNALQWDTNTGALLGILTGHTDIIRSVEYSADGKFILTGSNDNSARLWRSTSGELVRTFADHSKLVTSARFSPDQKSIVTGGREKRAKIWNMETGKLKGVLEGHTDSVEAIDYSPDGKFIATAGGFDRTARIWDLDSGELVHTLKGNPPFSVSWVSYSPDGNRVAMGGWNETIRVWDAGSGVLRLSINTGSDHVLSAAYSPDGKVIATGGADGRIRFWSASSGLPLKEFKRHADGVGELAFSPDGKRVVTASWDKTARIWDFESGDLLVTMLSDRNKDWIVITPEGFYAASNKKTELLTVVRGFETIKINQFYQVLYRPDLVLEKLAGDPAGKVLDAANRLSLDKIVESGNAPKVRVISPPEETIIESNEVTIQVELTDQGGGIGRVEWRINGLTLGVQPSRGLARRQGDSNDGNEGRLILRRSLLLEDGKNLIEVIAFNSSNLIASEPALISLQAVDQSPTQPNLHVMTVGVDDYHDSRLRLNYAVSDATAIAEAIRVAAGDLYASVEVTSILDNAVTESNLDKVFRRLADRIHPRDVFIFFLAGHGKTVDGEYYFIPQNFRYRNPSSIENMGIGQDKWQEWFSKVAARKSFLLYDTCESGSLTGDRVAARGMERITALEKLTRAMGRTVLTASADDEQALEGYRGHGVFTYALLEALGRSDTNANGLIEVTELASYVDEMVPKISHNAFGQRQIPQMSIAGSNFPIVRKEEIVESISFENSTSKTGSTHVIVKLANILSDPGAHGKVVEQLQPGVRVAVIRREEEWTLVAREGEVLGYVQNSSIVQLQ